MCTATVLASAFDQYKQFEVFLKSFEILFFEAKKKILLFFHVNDLNKRDEN